MFLLESKSKLVLDKILSWSFAYQEEKQAGGIQNDYLEDIAVTNLRKMCHYFSMNMFYKLTASLKGRLS